MSDPAPDPAAAARADLDAMGINLIANFADGFGARLPGMIDKMPARMRAVVKLFGPAIWPFIKVEATHAIDDALTSAVAGLKGSDAEMLDSVIRQMQAMVEPPTVAQ